MSISYAYPKYILGLFSLFLLTAFTSATFIVHSANREISDSSDRKTDQIKSGETVVPTDSAFVQTDTDSAFVQTDTESIRRISLVTNDVVYDGTSQKIFVSVPSSAGNIGNSITSIDPKTGVIGSSVFVGSEPSKLAIGKDGRTLYVALNGAGSIRRFDTSTQTPGLQFSLGQDSFFGVYQTNDLAVAPDNPNIVAVARYYSGVSPPEAGVAIFDNGVQRPQTGPGHIAGSDFLAFSNAGSILYGGGGYGGLRTMSIDANGVTVLDTTSFSVGARIKFDNGLIFSSTGQVIDTNTKTLLGTFSGVYSNAFVPDSTAGRAYYAVRDYSLGGISVKAFDINTFTPAGSFLIPNVSGDPATLVRWGANGLALRTSDNQLFLIQTTLIPSNEPIPTPTATPSVTPTPTPTNIPTFVRRVNLAVNDLVYNEPTQSIYASVASVTGSGIGNTITRVDPQTGRLISAVFIGSEPSKLALADDGRTLYARLDGANAIRRYDLLYILPGLQFSLSGSAQFHDMSVMPGSPQTIVIAADEVGVYDNGVKRPNTTNSINDIEFSDSPSVLYGLGYELVKFAVNASGVSSINSTSGLISGYNYSGMKFANGLLYTTSGQVVDPEARRLIGTFQTGGSTVAVDSALNRAFFLNSNVLTAYDTRTFLKIGSVTLSGVTGTPTSLVRWGTNGLAFRTSNGSGSGNNDSQLYIIQSELVSTTASVPIGMQLSASTFNAYESNQNLTVSVTRTGDLSVASTVNYATSDGTAIAGTDYTATSGTLNFAAGESSKNILVPIIDDNVFEGNETFNVALSNSSANTNLLYPNTAVATITDNDNQPYVSGNNMTVNEPVANVSYAIPVTVRLGNATTQTVTVNYATSNGTATAGSDYVATSGTLTFNPLETTKTVMVTINGDNSVEGDETFFLNISGAVNAYVSGGQITVTIKDFNPTLAHTTLFDYDGDGKADISVFRPSNGSWYLQQSQNGFAGMQFGIASDKIVPADYDGDFRTDIAVYRDGTWYLQRSNSGFTGFQFGDANDIPQPADFNGDGKADLAVFRPSNGTWYVYNLANNQFNAFQFGQAGDKPVVGDYDGDGKADYAVFRPSNATWYLSRSTAGFAAVRFGDSSTVPVPADYDGDRKTDIAIFIPSSGFWQIQKSQTGVTTATQFGTSTDTLAPADYDGDGKADIAVYRSNIWYIQRSQAGTIGIVFGASGDKAVPGAFVP